MKRIISLILVMVLCFGFVSESELKWVSAATDKENPVITEGTEIEVSFTARYEAYGCSFVPEESGWYKFYSTSNNSIQGAILDENSCIAESDNYAYDFLGFYIITGDFKIFQYLEAGETYYLRSIPQYYSGEEPCKYSIGIEKLPEATAVSIQKQEEINVCIGYKRTFNLYYTPEDCIPEKLTWSTSDPEIISIDENGECHFRKYGTATITVTTESGLTDSIVVNVTDIGQMRTNEVREGLSGNHSSAEYIFVPEISATYRINVKSDSHHIQQAPVNVGIYDEEYNLIESSDWTTDVSFYTYMEKGKCYCLKWEGYGGDVYGQVTATVKLGGEPDYEGIEIDTTDQLQQHGEEVASENIKEIKLDEEKPIDINYFGAKSIHKFTPVEDGEYKFSIAGNDQVLVDVLDENYHVLQAEESAPFSIKMEAGKTYIINSYISRLAYSGLGQYSLTINKLPKAETIAITNEKIVEHIGYSEKLILDTNPAESESEELIWTSSNKSIVDVDETGMVYLKNVGKATITVGNASGLTDSIEVECVHYPEVKSDKSERMTIIKKKTAFTFIPEVSGVYDLTIESYNEADIKVEIAKPTEKTELSMGSYTDINLQYQYEAGEIYYIFLENTSGEVLGVFDWTLELKDMLYENGDVNRDGILSAEDALMVLKSAAKVQELITEESQLADYNHDDVVDADDALKILKAVAKITE